MARKALKPLLDRLQDRLRELRTANAGNVTVTFALAIIPLIGGVGAAVDYSHASSVRAAMQAAADSTALMLAKNASSQTSTQLTERANEYFKALFTRADATGLSVSANYSTTGGSQVTVLASSNVKTSFMGIMGVPTIKVGVDSQARWGLNKMQIALALDNTGSMDFDGKMPALKTAAKEMLTTLQNAATNAGDIRVAIIPFAKYVNVGKSNVNATWLDWTAWEASNSSSSSGMTGSICYNGQLWNVNGSSWSYGGTCTTSAGICYNGTLWNWNGSSFVNGGTCQSGSANHSSWGGCVTDRDQDYDVKNTTPTAGTKATVFPTVNSSDCPVELMPLSYDWTALKGKIDEMKPDGYTNQGIGLAWAWMALTQGQPLNAPAKGADVQQIIVLMSDGQNTENRWYNDQAQIDARQAIACANIYTVLVMAGNSTVLKNCASKPEYYFEVTSANQTVAAFNAIGTQLAKLRIAQ
jgi:Flp pilus assembly protein TadG